MLKTYNAADNYYHLDVFKGANALVNDLEIENNDFSFIDEEILNMKVLTDGIDTISILATDQSRIGCNLQYVLSD